MHKAVTPSFSCSMTVPRNCGEEQFRGISRLWLRTFLEHFQFEMLRISNHTACRFAEKARFFPLTLGRAALCRRLRVSPFSKLKRSKKKYLMLQKCLFLSVRHCVRVLGRMGEFEGEGPPFCREQRPNGRPQAVSVRRRRSLTDIDSRAKGFLPPQDK